VAHPRFSRRQPILNMSMPSKLRSSAPTPTVSSTFDANTDLFLSSEGIPAPEFRLAAVPTKTSVSSVVPALRKGISSRQPLGSASAISMSTEMKAGRAAGISGNKVQDDESRVTEEAAEKALVELVLQTHEPDVPIDQGSVVPGFADGIRLLPHQVSSRTWMHDRETGGKFGGILADEMGCVFGFVHVVPSDSHFKVGKDTTDISPHC